MHAPLQPISTEEQEWANSLPLRRSKEYVRSRGYVRQALSELWEIPPLSIPLNAPPGQPPELEIGWGHISFSHCCDALLVGWSSRKLGVDLERVDRSFSASKLVDRYFNTEEKAELCQLKGDVFRTKVLERWLIKEAAIKWQQGNLAEDLSHWSLFPHSEEASHKLLGHKVSIHQLEYDAWRMAVACGVEMNCLHPILCLHF